MSSQPISPPRQHREPGSGGSGWRSPGDGRLRRNRTPPPPTLAGPAQTRAWAAIAGASIANALVDANPQIDPAHAQAYALTLLHNPNVSIGRGGAIYYQGKPYDAAQFAAAPLAQLVTGQTALERNKAAILGESGYMSDIAHANLQRQLDTAGLADQQRRAIIDYGDPTFAHDSILAGEAAANPFSITGALARARQIQLQGVKQQASDLGVISGGGYQAGVAGVNREQDAQASDALRSFTDLLSSVNQRQAQAQSVYNQAQNDAYAAAAQRLSASGALPAQSFTPSWSSAGAYRRYKRPPVRQGPGSRPVGPPPPPRPPQ